MVLESTVLCIDNSEFMRNGDYLPTRIQAQQDAANMICRTKLRSNPENNVALLSMADAQVHVTLTTDSGKLLSKLNTIQPKGDMKLLNGLRVAHLALKHRQSKNHRTRIVAFVGSPIKEDDKELVKVAKRLKKEKVSVDVINFGEQECNTEKLTSFVNTLNGKDGAGSHLVTIPPGSMLSGAIGSSPIVVEEGSMTSAAQEFDMGFDPNSDPELALALRVSLEEQRHRQEEEARKAKNETQSAPPTAGGGEEKMLEDPPATAPAAPTSEVDIAMMTEEEQIAYALTMSMQATPEDSIPQTPMETESAVGFQGQMGADSEDDDDDVIVDPGYLQSVLESLPGVNPNSEAVQQAMREFAQKKDGETKTENDDEDDDDAIIDPNYLQSVLESLPGVNPNSEAVQQAMSEFAQKKDGEKKGNSSKNDKK